MAVFEGFQLTLNCDFVAVADRKYCQVFYGREKLLGEEVAAYSFFDDAAFDQALALATALSGKPYFEKLWSAKRFEDRPGGYVCLKRQQGLSLITQLRKESRQKQFRLCMKLVKAIKAIHQQGRAHGALDEDNVLFDERQKSPYILEVLSGFHTDQLEPHLCAPEQIQGNQIDLATDVYWLGNLFFREIKRPSYGLRQLIKRCTHQDSAQRPSLEDVGNTLNQLLTSDWEETVKRWLRPQWSLKIAGGVILLAAGAILAFDQGFFQSAPAPTPVSFETQLEQGFEEISRIPASTVDFTGMIDRAENDYQRQAVVQGIVQKALSNRKFAEPGRRSLRQMYSQTSDLRTREGLIASVSDINFSQMDRGLRVEGHAGDLDQEFVGLMLFDWPVLLVSDQVWELGDWVTANGYRGYIASMSLTHIDIKDGRNIYSIPISTQAQMTSLDWTGHNIYIRGKRENMRMVINAFKHWGYDVLIEGLGGSPGFISGYFNFPTPEAFLDELKSNLKLTVSGTTIWIEDAVELRTYIPLVHYVISNESCEGIIRQLFQFTGMNVSMGINDGPCPKVVYCVDTELKSVIKKLGYKCSPPNSDAEKIGITISRKE